MAIITISRGTFSGGMSLAECLSAELGYRFLSREELLAAAAEQFGTSAEDLESALMFRPGFLEVHRSKKRHYIYCVQATLAKAVQGDDIVYHGQAGHLLLKGIPHHLRLRVVADMEYRIKEAMRRGKLKRDQAIEFIHERDEARDKWVKWVYGADRSDPTLFDLIINLERTSIENACRIVAVYLERDFRTTPESQKIMDDFVLASDIKARIGMDEAIADDMIEVEVKNGTVSVSGSVASVADADRVRTLIRKVPGVKKIRSKLGTRWWT